MSEILPLGGLKVIDFSTLLPGPLATLILARTGAKVIKIERPGSGDEMRAFTPPFADASANFALLNEGKEIRTFDLKSKAEVSSVRQLILESDVLVEQFRPGVMDRLGLGFKDVSKDHPRLIYCSISGYGQTGPRRSSAGHDLNYLALTGMLSLVSDSRGAPVMPPALIADIGGGSYPAVMNILLAVLQRERTGRGTHLDVAMAENLFPWMYWALGAVFATGKWPVPGGEVVTGGSPRYNLYRTRDGHFIAMAAMEDRFWIRVCELLELPGDLASGSPDRDAAQLAVAKAISERTSDDLDELFQSEDVCCEVVRTLEGALADPHFLERGVFKRKLSRDGETIPALPLPIVDALQRSSDD